MIRELEIEIRPASSYSLEQTDEIIVVDGCKGNRNISDLDGKEIAVIDHHESKAPEDVDFVDIRPDYGSCSTIIYTYFQELELTITESVATALMIGLLLDTAHLTRGLNKTDLTCHADLYELANKVFVNSILRNNIQQQDLYYFRKALDKVIIQNRFAFCYFDEGCNQNLLGILANFFLSIQEVGFVFLCAKNDDQINLSIRSEDPDWNAAQISRTILGGIVFGGGHRDMAGGIIEDVSRFNADTCYKELRTLLLEQKK
jgi:nanoRNase/pAp phosphatase (c-di-AMP/oligoRNAs hydrolase)